MMKRIANLFASLVAAVGIHTINTACIFIFGQPEEPASLSKYSKKR